MKITAGLMAAIIGLASLFFSSFSFPGTDASRPAPAPIDALRWKIATLAYVAGHRSSGKKTGLLRHQANKSCPGLNIFATSGWARAAVMDLSGTILHRWKLPTQEIWPELEEPWDTGFSKIHVFPNGDLLGIVDGLDCLAKIDRNSRVLWTTRNTACRFHHDFDFGPEGTIYILVKEKIPAPAALNREGEIWNDRIARLTSGGEVIDTLSLVKCFLNSPYRPLLDRVPPEPDVFHSNKITVLKKGDLPLPQIGGGEVLVSIRNIDTLAVIDPERETVVWALTGLWSRQHYPEVLETGRILVFDNLAKSGSRVVEVDPLSQKIAWSFQSCLGEPFFSKTGGANQRLANGNTLITETNTGRAFEVTPAGEIVWEYITPDQVRIPGEEPRAAEINRLFRFPEGNFPFLNRADQ